MRKPGWAWKPIALLAKLKKAKSPISFIAAKVLVFD